MDPRGESLVGQNTEGFEGEGDCHSVVCSVYCAEYGTRGTSIAFASEVWR